ncbi:hypothetical protein [Limosilactobacillus reuteri]|uniref:hypothetical protein n=1 Tax=Limosilactobacillus reuteri TaxID=1598 RepID=UPI001CDB656B|nr:hypothetical protein [Limosilactobacillus reuteri]
MQQTHTKKVMIRQLRIIRHYFRKYPQRIINVTNKFIKGKMHALRDYVDGYEDAKQQLSQK